MIGYIILGCLALFFAAFLLVVGVRYRKLMHKRSQDKIEPQVDSQFNTTPSDIADLENYLAKLQDDINSASKNLENQRKALNASCRSQDAAISQLDGVLNQLARGTVENKAIEARHSNLLEAVEAASSSLNMAKLEISNFQREKDQLTLNYQKEINNKALELESKASQLEIIKMALAKLKDYDVKVMLRHNEAMVRAYELSQGKSGALRFAQRELSELKELGDVICKLSNPAPFNKAVYEMYYRDKMKEMLANLGLNGRVSGIYRLGMIIDGVEVNYVGQSVDIGERGVQHLKRFVGSEPATGIRLYKDERVDLKELKGEVIEECEQSELNEREKYGIGFYNCGGGGNSKA